MSLVLADRVRETTQTTGTGTITLDGAVQGFQSFTVIGNNNTTYYTINRGSEWEVGLGTYYGGTLSRDTIYASSNSGNKVNFSAGTKDVFVTYPAEKSVNEDANNRVLIPYTSGTTNVGSLNVGDATAHTDSGVIAGFTASEPLYLYTSLQNTSASNTSYASYAVNDGGHTAYGELGINNSNYSYSAAGYPNNGFSTPLATFVESYGGPLVLGSWDNQKISMIINGAVSTTDAMTINTNGSVAFNGQVGTAGQILQSNATSAPTWVTPSGGTVTSVTGTAPVVSSGGTTPVISMAAATTSVDGYLTSTDWTTFNGKQAALVSGTNIKTVNSNSLLGSGNVSVGTVTSVGGTGTVNGLSLSGTVTSSGNLTFGGTLDLSSPPVIGGTAAAAGSFTTLIGGSGSANYEQITGGAAGKAVQFQSLGSDAAVSLAIQSKGTTGAIDLSAQGGVNISNGGTVTAITRTAAGSGYTSPPTWSASAPTTAGGTTSSGTTTLSVVSSTLGSGGTGGTYAVNDVLTVTGGTSTQATQITVNTVSAGVILTYTVTTGGNYTVVPSNPVSVTGGGGTGATFNLTWGITSAGLAISVAGSGYVEQPTVTFSGGGGSGAAAYATVGSGTTVKSVGSTMSFTTPAGEQFRVIDNANPTVYWQAFGSAGNAILRSTAAGLLQSSGANQIAFQTNQGSTQFNIAHTASAVNYVQVTGGVTGNNATISAQGSDASIGLSFVTKGGFGMQFNNSSGGSIVQYTQSGTTSATTNYLRFTNYNGSGTSPIISTQGGDTDISLSLVPKGLGIVLLNQQTPTAVTATGTLTIANLLTQIITSTSATAVSLTLPTGTLSDAGVSGGTSAVNTSFDYSIINTGSAVGDVTMVAGTAHTIVGSVSIPVGTSGRFRCRKTATNTFVSYRV